MAYNRSLNDNIDAILTQAEAYLPGQTSRPQKDLFAPLKDGIHSELGPEQLAYTQAFRGALALFEARYYWEAHELFEAIWMALPPASVQRVFVQALIQVANAGLKGRMGRPDAARRIMALAQSGLEEASVRSSFPIMALARAQVDQMISQAQADSGL